MASPCSLERSSILPTQVSPVRITPARGTNPPQLNDEMGHADGWDLVGRHEGKRKAVIRWLKSHWWVRYPRDPSSRHKSSIQKCIPERVIKAYRAWRLLMASPCSLEHPSILVMRSSTLPTQVSPVRVTPAKGTNPPPTQRPDDEHCAWLSLYAARQPRQGREGKVEVFLVTRVLTCL
jgi:hypothetical protein